MLESLLFNYVNIIDSHPVSQYPNPGLNIPAGVNYPDKKVPLPDTPGYPFTTPLIDIFNYVCTNHT
jgi:hypothetical protein